MSEYCLSSSSKTITSGKVNQHGLSLVELMIAMTIGLFLLAAIGSVFLSSKQTYRTGDNLSRMQENGRFAVDWLGKEIRVAGYVRISFTPPLTFGLAPSPYTFSGSALDATAVSGSKSGADSITVSYDGTTDCFGTTVVSPVINAYSVNASNQLMCNGQVLLDGVEDMQIQYGESVGSNTHYVTTPSIKANTVRLCVLFRTIDNNVATQAQTYSDCNGTSVTASTGDRYIHRAFAATMNVRSLTP